jgi:hypothetical protein
MKLLNEVVSGWTCVEDRTTEKETAAREWWLKEWWLKKTWFQTNVRMQERTKLNQANRNERVSTRIQN